MLDIIKGQTTKNAETGLLIDFLQKKESTGRLYVGYVMPMIHGQSLQKVDVLWISKKYGIIAFNISREENEDEVDELYRIIDVFLRSNKEFIKKRDLLVPIEVITYNEKENEIGDKLNELEEWQNNNLFDNLISSLQSVATLRNKSERKNVKKDNSRGAKLKWLDNQLSVLDNEQERAIIEYSNGIQRIRGLAGSGKTIVLALKAAYLHTQNPDWDIIITFNTRSLKRQYKDLITKFCLEKGVDVDWEKIRIVNAWGKSSEPWNEKGIYYTFCNENNIQYLNFRQAQSYAISTGLKKERAFEAACKKAIQETEGAKTKQKYDIILVDEAQDLSRDFLLICYRLLKEPNKRLIYAYDELQRLDEGETLPNPESNFGGNNFDDNILKRCYRNSRPLLVTAHALGFGIYRKEGLVQFFDQPKLWGEVGYELIEGELTAGKNVSLARTKESSPSYLENVSKDIAGVNPLDDLLVFKSFSYKHAQAEWVASEINKNINEDELLFKDILVINPIGFTTRNEVAMIRSILAEKYNIQGHIAGENDADVFFEPNSITFTGIHRAKGNEVSMVYIINADECYEGVFNAKRDLIKRRNTLFTAITRSKVWVRVCGTGSEMESLIEEFEIVKSKNFTLDFIYPTQDEIDKMNVIHRDISDREKQEIIKSQQIFTDIQEMILKINSGEKLLQDYPQNVQTMLEKFIQK